MPHTYTNTLVHCVFSTKNRAKLISPQIQPRLHPYLAGIARVNGMNPIAVGGVEDHVHLLFALPAILPLAKAVQSIKGGSSKWLHETFPEIQEFAWQQGYGAFSISVTQVERTRRYIEGQAEHHRCVSFEEEFVQFLKTHGIEYDPRFLWG